MSWQNFVSLCEVIAQVSGIYVPSTSNRRAIHQAPSLLLYSYITMAINLSLGCEILRKINVSDRDFGTYGKMVFRFQTMFRSYFRFSNRKFGCLGCYQYQAVSCYGYGVLNVSDRYRKSLPKSKPLPRT